PHSAQASTDQPAPTGCRQTLKEGGPMSIVHYKNETIRKVMSELDALEQTIGSNMRCFELATTKSDEENHRAAVVALDQISEQLFNLRELLDNIEREALKKANAYACAAGYCSILDMGLKFREPPPPDPDFDKLIEAHAKEADRLTAEFYNFGWVTGGDE